MCADIVEQGDEIISVGQLNQHPSPELRDADLAKPNGQVLMPHKALQSSRTALQMVLSGVRQKPKTPALK